MCKSSEDGEKSEGDDESCYFGEDSIAASKASDSKISGGSVSSNNCLCGTNVVVEGGPHYVSYIVGTA